MEGSPDWKGCALTCLEMQGVVRHLCQQVRVSKLGVDTALHRQSCGSDTECSVIYKHRTLKERLSIQCARSGKRNKHRKRVGVIDDVLLEDVPREGKLLAGDIILLCYQQLIAVSKRIPDSMNLSRWQMQLCS
jgi:hypothetical protein